MKAAMIEFGSSAISYIVRDLSITGAGLEVSSQTGIPEKLPLVMPGDGLRLPCTIVQCGVYLVGVAFD